MSDFYPATGLTGGGSGDLDAIDGAGLSWGDKAIVLIGGGMVYFYSLDDTSGASEDSPRVIAPDANAGDKRWILIEQVYLNGILSGRNHTLSGADAVIAGGNMNSAIGNKDAVAGGESNYSDVWDSESHQFIGGGLGNYMAASKGVIGGGESNYSEGAHSVIGGGYYNESYKPFAAIPGGKEASAHLYGMEVFSAGKFSNAGDAQRSSLVSRNATSDATQTELFLDGSSERMALPASRTWAFEITVAARQTGGGSGTIGDSWVKKYAGAVKRDGSNNMALVGSVSETAIAADAGASGWSVTVDADDTNESLRIRVTGEADKTIHWVAKVSLVEVG